MAAASAAAGGAALGGLNPNPSANGPSLRPPGEHVALADVTNTERPNRPRSIHVADVLKENAKLLHLLREKTKVIEVSRVEMHKLRFMLHAVHQQNLHLAQTNSKTLAELNQGKDRLKELQHELACTKAALKVKASELEKKNKTTNRPQKKVNSQKEIKAIPSKLAPIEAHQIDNKATSANAHHLVETQFVVSSNTGCQEPPQDKTNKRMSVSRCINKRKSETSEVIRDTNTVQHNYKPHLQSSGSLHHEDPRKTLRRRSARLNPGSCEVTEVSCETLCEEVVVPSAPSSFSIPKSHEPNTGKDMGKSLHNELPCNTSALQVKASELKKNETNMQPQKKVNLEEIQESRSTVAGVEAYQIGDKATNNNPNHSAETQSSLPFNIEHPEPPQERRNKRKSACRSANKRKLESCEGPKDSNIEEDINAIRHSSSGESLNHEEKRKSPRRKSARMNPGSFEVTKGVFETLHEDIVAPLAPSGSTVLIEQSKNEKQNGCCSPMKSSEEQATGRRSSFWRPLRRAAEKIVSYKEIPLNVKMRRV